MKNLKSLHRIAQLVFSLLGVSLLVLGISGCKQDKDKTSEASPTPTPPHITLALQYPQIQFAGVYAALSQGYFVDEGIDVAILPLEETIINPDAGLEDVVLAGNAQMGLTQSDRLLKRCEHGDNLVAFMTLYQLDPMGIVSLKDTQIERPADLVGKRIVNFYRGLTVFTMFLNAVELDAAQVTVIDGVALGIETGINDFLTGQVDGLIVPLTDFSAQMDALNLEYNTMLFFDYGIRIYPNVLFTTQQFMQDEPDAIQHFTNAVVRGLQYAIEHPDEIVAWFLEQYGEYLVESLKQGQDEAMKAIIPLIRGSTNSQLGMMNATVWQSTSENMVASGLLSAEVDPTACYTLQFLDAYYSQSG